MKIQLPEIRALYQNTYELSLDINISIPMDKSRKTVEKGYLSVNQRANLMLGWVSKTRTTSQLELRN